MPIRDLRRIRHMLDLKIASAIATSVVQAKLDYCNSLFLNIDTTQINRLQAIQDALARAVTKTPKHHHITPVLKNPTGSTYLNESNTKQYQQYHSTITHFNPLSHPTSVSHSRPNLLVQRVPLPP